METTSKLFLSFFVCLALSLTNGCGDADKADIAAAQPVKMVERHIGSGKLMIRDVRDDQTEEFSLRLSVQVRNADSNKFDKRYATCMDEVVTKVYDVLNMTSDEERIEAGMQAIKAKVQQAINEVLGTSWVQEVIVTEPMFITGKPNG